LTVVGGIEYVDDKQNLACGVFGSLTQCHTRLKKWQKNRLKFVWHDICVQKVIKIKIDV